MTSKEHKLKTEFEGVHLISVDLVFEEKLDAQKLANYTKMKEEKFAFTEKSGSIRITVREDALVLSRALWWPNQKEKQLPYTQLKDVYTFEKEPKKVCIDIASAQSVQRRILLFKLKSADHVSQFTNLLLKRKMITSMYGKDNVLPVQYGDWLSSYHLEQDPSGNGSTASGAPGLSRDRFCSPQVIPTRTDEVSGHLCREPLDAKELVKMQDYRNTLKVYPEGPVPFQYFEPQSATNILIIFQGVQPSAHPPIPCGQQALPKPVDSQTVERAKQGYLNDRDGDSSERSSSRYVTMYKRKIFGPQLDTVAITTAIAMKNEKPHRSTSDLFSQSQLDLLPSTAVRLQNRLIYYPSRGGSVDRINTGTRNSSQGSAAASKSEKHNALLSENVYYKVKPHGLLRLEKQ